MATFAIFANGTYWGTHKGADEAEAMQAMADELGTEGNTEGMTAHEVTDDQAEALAAWSDNGAVASLCPIRA